MRIHKFENIYPRVFWIACTNECEKLLSKFVFFTNIEPWDTVNDNILEDLEEADTQTIASCYAVLEKSTGKLGILLVISRPEDVNMDIAAHEAVHIADYYFDVCGLRSQGFEDGNEAYAYLVGWVAGCISNVLIKENYGKTK